MPIGGGRADFLQQGLFRSGRTCSRGEARRARSATLIDRRREQDPNRGFEVAKAEKMTCRRQGDRLEFPSPRVKPSTGPERDRRWHALGSTPRNTACRLGWVPSRSRPRPSCRRPTLRKRTGGFFFFGPPVTETLKMGDVGRSSTRQTSRATSLTPLGSAEAEGASLRNWRRSERGL